MRPEPWTHLDRFRIRKGELGSPLGAPFGAFLLIDRPQHLMVIATDGADERGHTGWEHVSVSLQRRCPNWPEMCAVKELFWMPDETVLQFHPPRSVYVNDHPNCLHLWRPLALALPLPPTWMIGRRDGESMADLDAARDRDHPPGAA